MGAAAAAFTLWTRRLKHNPADPLWPDRDRFVLSAGHASMLLYTLLYLSGYDLTLDDLKAHSENRPVSPLALHPFYRLKKFTRRRAALAVLPRALSIVNIKAMRSYAAHPLAPSGPESLTEGARLGRRPPQEPMAQRPCPAPAA